MLALTPLLALVAALGVSAKKEAWRGYLREDS
jgi:hypothetical protein